MLATQAAGQVGIGPVVAPGGLGSMVEEWRAALCDHLPGMRRFARRRVRDEALADDAVQDALEAALAALPSFQGNSSLRTWLYGILTHKIQDAFRREARYCRRQEAGLFDDARQDGSGDADAALLRAADADASAGWVEDPLDAIARKRFESAIVSAVEQLPAAQREVFLMQAVEGRSTAAVCRDLGISESNCWVRLHRARKRLSTELQAHG